MVKGKNIITHSCKNAATSCKNPILFQYKCIVETRMLSIVSQELKQTYFVVLLGREKYFYFYKLKSASLVYFKAFLDNLQSYTREVKE